MARLAIGFALGVTTTVLVAIGVWLVVVYTGAYNVAASDQHADAVRWTLDTTMHRSEARRAGEVGLPEHPPPELLAKGAGHYAESCAQCHGAPGQEPAEWSRGMRPEPPHLTEAATEWTAEEIYWIAANGIKMTGMPAFGKRHGPEELGALAAFVDALPGLSPDDYAMLTASAPGHSGLAAPAAAGGPQH